MPPGRRCRPPRRCQAGKLCPRRATRKLVGAIEVDAAGRWQAYSRQLRQDPALVAYYTFESAGQSNAILPNQSSAGSALDGQVEGAEWVYGRLPGKYALYFHGPGSGDKVVLPEQERFNFTGPFSVVVWFRPDRFTTTVSSVDRQGRHRVAVAPA